MAVLLRDVTLREYGQNVPRSAVAAFDRQRVWLAQRLLASGLQALEVASVASPTVAPAMADASLVPLVRALGHPEEVELITLVPTRQGYQRFLGLGLGPQELHHSMGVFLSALDEHNLANLRRTVAESLVELGSFVPEAVRLGVKVHGYVSAAFGFLPAGGHEIIPVEPRRIAELVRALVDLGVATVTVSDLQGVASPATTGELIQTLLAGPDPCPVPLGYHGHHQLAESALDNVEAAVLAGVGLVDASLAGVGGCVTGAPGNAPTEGVARRLEALGFAAEIAPAALAALAEEATQRLFHPLRQTFIPT